jgi:glycosyltransferase involved in cell wall biosynthesis
MEKSKKPTILMITPALAGGSFIALKQFAEAASQQFNCIILGLGFYKNQSIHFKVINIPYFRYDGLWGHLASKFTIFGFLSEIPLYFTSLFYLIKLKPKIVIYNGLATMIPLILPSKLLGIKIVLSFRSWWDEKRFGFIKKIMIVIGKYIDLAFVNSDGSNNNLSKIISSNKIITIGHHANIAYFKKQDRNRLRTDWNISNKFVISFVGRIDEEKFCPFLFKCIRKFKNDQRFQFYFAGNGRLVPDVKQLEKDQNNVRYLGFINKTEQLAEIYSVTDLLWSYADETYFARPAIEAISCGTPVIFPSTPAIGEKIINRIKIEKSFLNKDIGWMIDLNLNQTIKIIKKIRNHNMATKKRQHCRQYGLKNYFMDPNMLLVTKCKQLIDQLQ